MCQVTAPHCLTGSACCRNLLDLRVSITGGVHFDLVKRVLRDISRSEQAPQDIIQQVNCLGSTLLGPVCIKVLASPSCKRHAQTL